MKTLTFTVEDALLSPIGFSVLSGAGLIKGTEDEQVHLHVTTSAIVSVANGETATIDLADALNSGEKICATAPLFVVITESDGSVTGEVVDVTTVSDTALTVASKYASKTVLVDYYVIKSGSTVNELQIDAENFAGYYYVEGDTLFRRQADGKDLPAQITFPNVKIQSNFTFTMASSGDPSTFTFTMDAMPGYTYFDKTKKVLCVIQIVDDTDVKSTAKNSVMSHEENESLETYEAAQTTTTTDGTTAATTKGYIDSYRSDATATT